MYFFSAFHATKNHSDYAMSDMFQHCRKKGCEVVLYENLPCYCEHEQLAMVSCMILGIVMLIFFLLVTPQEEYEYLKDF